MTVRTVLLFAVAWYATYGYGDDLQKTPRASNRNDKDFVLGALIPIHEAIDGGGKCGEIR